jgi:hypothetical protein
MDPVFVSLYHSTQSSWFVPLHRSTRSTCFRLPVSFHSITVESFMSSIHLIVLLDRPFLRLPLSLHTIELVCPTSPFHSIVLRDRLVVSASIVPLDQTHVHRHGVCLHRLDAAMLSTHIAMQISADVRAVAGDPSSPRSSLIQAKVCAAPHCASPILFSCRSPMPYHRRTDGLGARQGRNLPSGESQCALAA